MATRFDEKAKYLEGRIDDRTKHLENVLGNKADSNVVQTAFKPTRVRSTISVSG
jgi:hypothetical protein